MLHTGHSTQEFCEFHCVGIPSPGPAVGLRHFFPEALQPKIIDRLLRFNGPCWSMETDAKPTTSSQHGA